MEETIVAKWSGKVGGGDGLLMGRLRSARRASDLMALGLLAEHDDWLGAEIEMWVTEHGIGVEGVWRVQDHLGCEEFRTGVRHVPWDELASPDGMDLMDALCGVAGDMEADYE